MRLKRYLLRGRRIRRLLAFRRVVSAKVAVKTLARTTQLRKRAASDAALIDSLNRYIDALEGKAAMQAELIQELRVHLSGIAPKKEEIPS